MVLEGLESQAKVSKQMKTDYFKHLVAAICLLLGTTALYAHDVEIDGIYYNLITKAKQATVTYEGEDSYSSSYSGAVTIPPTIESGGVTYNVTSIGDKAFAWCSGLTSVTIPSSVTSIGYEAFRRCSGLTSVTIPSSVPSIGNYAFQECSSLTSVTIPSSVTSIGAGAFSGCSGLTSITIPSSVTSIGNSVFSGCSGLTSVTIPSIVTNIGGWAFQGCSGLTSVTIPSSVTSIGLGAFEFCSGLTSVTIPSSVTEIRESAFHGCSSLTSVTIPSSVTSIEREAFYGCSGLTSVTIPSSVMHIEYRAFYECDNLKTVTFHGNSLGAQAFANCSELTDVYYNGYMNDGVLSMGSASSDAFDGSYIEYATLHVPSELLSQARSSEPWNQFGTITTIDPVTYPSTITLTDGEAFTGYPVDVDMTSISYARTFNNTSWQSWYVPFDVEVTSDLLSRFSFAKYAGTYVDEDSDPSFFITIVKMKAGDVLKANIPYFVQAKTASSTAQVITVTDATLKSAQETGFDMYSAEHKVSIRGVYAAKTATASDCDWYAYGGGKYIKATAGAVLNPFRVYLSITPRADNPYGTSETPSYIKVKLLGEGGETEILEVATDNEPQAEVYDLSGRRVKKDKLSNGIFIINGKKVLVK